MLQIGSYKIGGQAVLAPMAGVADLPFRSLCSKLGAGLVVNEMLTSDTRLWGTHKSQNRLAWGDINGPRVVQIAGNEPYKIAEAAKSCVDLGAQIIDLNMGCPAKKVCNKAAGSALLKDETLVENILNAVVNAVNVPVSLKIRTGWDIQNRNALTIAKIAENAGVLALTIHGRTRQCRFKGEAEYDTIAEIAQTVGIPIIANGDIDSPEKAKYILAYTRAQAVMIGRAAQGNPWLFREVNHFLSSGDHMERPTIQEVEGTILDHLYALHDFYGEHLGARIARKHLGWYIEKQVYPFQGNVKSDPSSDRSARKHQGNQISIHGDEQLSGALPPQECDALNGPLNRASTKLWRQHFNSQITKKQQLNAVRNLFERLQLLKDQAA